jgi:hypothetical protein
MAWRILKQRLLPAAPGDCAYLPTGVVLTDS